MLVQQSQYNHLCFCYYEVWTYLGMQGKKKLTRVLVSCDLIWFDLILIPCIEKEGSWLVMMHGEAHCNMSFRKLEILRTGWRSWSLTVKVSMLQSRTFISHDSAAIRFIDRWLKVWFHLLENCNERSSKTVTTGGGTGSSQCTYLLDCARAESSFTAPSNTLTWDTAEGHLLEVGQDVKPTLFSVPAHTWWGMH